MNVGDKSKALAEDSRRRELSRACLEGLEAFRRDAEVGAAGTVGDGKKRNRWVWPRAGEMQYQETGGDHESRIYDLKIRGMRLVNVWRQTVLAAASTPFNSAPILKDWPEKIQGDPEDPQSGWKAAVDDERRDFAAYWAHEFLLKLVDGVNHTLVTKAEASDAYFVNVIADQIQGYEHMAVGGEKTLAEVRIMMPPKIKRGAPSDEPNKWTERTVVPRVLVYRTSAYHGGAVDGPPVFRYVEKRKVRQVEKWVWADADWTPLEVRSGADVVEIPLYHHYGHYVAPGRGWPVFDDTASQQAALVRKLLDYDLRVYKDSRNLLVVVGAEPGSAKAASQQKAEAVMRGDALYIPHGSSATHVETSGQALKALRDDMDSVKEDIRVGNLRPLLMKPQPQTATEVITYQRAASTLLEMWVLQDIATYEQAFTMKARLDGLDPEGGKIELPHDFDRNPEIVGRLWDGYLQSGGELVPPEVMWPELSRAQWVSEKLDIDEIAGKVRAAMAAGLEGERTTAGTE